jgi:hypothetical protein
MANEQQPVYTITLNPEEQRFLEDLIRLTLRGQTAQEYLNRIVKAHIRKIQQQVRAVLEEREAP